ncbi:hypothetical protein MPTK1_5g08230 [Marchantia polymorpha subsp. ruderalis]|uniref:Uncharacterized protein n=2 Tax=Marchantia polymorpha TaxID=3197 RepID=A0AAF6BG63_MARPO|nr:hypothetical protein MARPO_0086s0026 [Marchantia polymorpha]BBN10997.1 hypothetical protein Mp_5g08230 [Marchantia polymorpha subsp. ruderalis]|eukprot:PTQ33694.1 hypothetical protein MARPO_0086s0026 [Marchantia polymorpha]
MTHERPGFRPLDISNFGVDPDDERNPCPVYDNAVPHLVAARDEASESPRIHHLDRYILSRQEHNLQTFEIPYHSLVKVPVGRGYHRFRPIFRPNCMGRKQSMHPTDEEIQSNRNTGDKNHFRNRTMENMTVLCSSRRARDNHARAGVE